MKRYASSFLGLLGLVLGCVSTVSADEWSVSPLKLDLGGAVRSGVFSVRNLGGVEKTFSVVVKGWSQDAEGKDVETETGDLIFFPATLVVPPSDYAVVRIGARNPIAETERAYRVYVAEIPQTPEMRGDQGATMQVVLRIGLPVFIQPRHKVSKLEIQLQERGGVISAKVSNPGNVHIRADEVRFRGLDSQGNEKFSQALPERYLLAGVTRSYRLSVPGDVCGLVSRVQLNYEVAGKTVWSAEANASGTACETK